MQKTPIDEVWWLTMLPAFLSCNHGGSMNRNHGHLVEFVHQPCKKQHVTLHQPGVFLFGPGKHGEEIESTNVFVDIAAYSVIASLNKLKSLQSSQSGWNLALSLARICSFFRKFTHHHHHLGVHLAVSLENQLLFYAVFIHNGKLPPLGL